MQTAEWELKFSDDGWVCSELNSSATGEQLEQLGLIVFAAFVARQSALLKPGDASISKALLVLESRPSKLEALLDQLPFLWGTSGRTQRGFRIRITCTNEFRFDGWSDTPNESLWPDRVLEWQLTLDVEPFGFSSLTGKPERKHALLSVLALLYALGSTRTSDPLALDRLAYAATEAIHHHYGVDPLPMAAFVAHTAWTGQFCPTCETARERAVDRCADCGHVFRGDPSIVLENDPRHHAIRRTADSGDRATLGTSLALSDDEVRVDITPLELADPASVTNWSSRELRPVAIRVKARNRSDRTLDGLSVIDAQLIDENGRSYDADLSADLEPSFDDIEDLDPGETARGWIVFGLPSNAAPTIFTYQTYSGETGVWALVELPVGPAAP